MLRVMEGKRGQVVLFVIMAVVIVGVVVFLVLVNSGNRIDSEINVEIQSVHSFVQSCVGEVGEDALYYIGRSGGYFELEENERDNGVSVYYDGKDRMISKEKLEKELGRFVEESLFFCVKGFRDFSEFEISGGEINSEVKILDDKVKFEVDYLLSITRGENSYQLRRFEYDSEIRLNRIYEFVRKFIDEQVRYKDSLCFGCLANLAEEYDLYIDMFDKDDLIIIGVVDKESKISRELEEEEYRFYFAVII
jgi:hypothetical protein